MDVNQMKDLLKQQLDAFAAGDWKAYRATFADNPIYEEEATRRRVQGADAIEQAVKPWKDAFPDIRFKLKDAVASGDALVVELEWSGTQKGPLVTPLGAIQPTNKAGNLPAVQVVRFDGNKIREVRHYFDLLTILVQLGVMPQRGAQPQP